MKQAEVALNIAQNNLFSPYVDIICANSCQKLTKSEIGSSWSRFEHCSESLVLPIGSHMWSLFVPVHVQIWPKVKLGQVEVDSNIAQNHFHIVHRKSDLLIIYINSYDDMHNSGDTAQ